MRFFTLAAFAAGASATYTVTQTAQVTITSCGPSVTNCPAAAAQTPGGYGYGGVPPVSPVAQSSAPVSASPVWQTSSYTSTIFSTKVVTVTSCAPTVTNCPANQIGTTTVVIPISTTICPITAAAPTTANTQYKPWGTGNSAAPVKPSSTGWYASGTPKVTPSISAYTGAASHAKAGSFVAGVGIFAAFFL